MVARHGKGDPTKTLLLILLKAEQNPRYDRYLGSVPEWKLQGPHGTKAEGWVQEQEMRDRYEAAMGSSLNRTEYRNHLQKHLGILEIGTLRYLKRKRKATRVVWRLRKDGPALANLLTYLVRVQDPELDKAVRESSHYFEAIRTHMHGFARAFGTKLEHAVVARRGFSGDELAITLYENRLFFLYLQNPDIFRRAARKFFRFADGAPGKPSRGKPSRGKASRWFWWVIPAVQQERALFDFVLPHITLSMNKHTRRNVTR